MCVCFDCDGGSGGTAFLARLPNFSLPDPQLPPPPFDEQMHVGGGRATGLVIGDTAVPFRCIMPIGAGIIVAWLQSQGFSPALKFLTRAIEGVVDDNRNAALPTSYWQVWM